MAQAGFIFVPTQEQPDLSKCSYCGFYLYDLGGNPDIWTQHQNQAPQCLFVKRWQAQANSFEHPITQASERKKGTPPSPKSVTEPKAKTEPPPLTNGNHSKGEDDDGGDGVCTQSTFDDSIWDIASVQKAKRRRTTSTAPRITYSSKKRKRSTRILSPGLSNQASVLSSLNQSANGSLQSQSKPKNQATAMEHDLTRDTSAKKPKETAAQLFARLQKRPNASYTSEEKGKGRAIDISPPLATPSKESTSSTSKRLTKDSLRLSTSKKNLKTSPVTKTTKTIAASSSSVATASSSSTSLSITATSLYLQDLVQQALSPNK
ncbi:unnamed protein product [Absidia cylindrospora]